MRKKVIVSASILVLILASLIILFLTSFNKKTEIPQVKEEENNPISKIASDAQSTLALAPNPVVLDENNSGSISVILDTKTNYVTAVQLELLYDPKAITNVIVKSSKFFAKPVELMNRVDKNTGRITYMLGISPAQDPISGKGEVAVITFNKVAGTQIKGTKFSFSRTENSESIVAATGIDLSVLKTTTDTTILLD